MKTVRLNLENLTLATDSIMDQDSGTEIRIARMGDLLRPREEGETSGHNNMAPKRNLDFL